MSDDHHSPQDAVAVPALSGISGWLGLFAFNCILGIPTAILMVPMLIQLAGVLPALPKFPYALTILYMVCVVGSIVWIIMATILLFQRKRRTISAHTISAVFSIAAKVLLFAVYASLGMQKDPLSSIANVAATLAWVVYLRKSVRVSNTLTQ